MISPHVEEVLEALYVCEFEDGRYIDESVSTDTLTEAADAGLLKLDAETPLEVSTDGEVIGIAPVRDRKRNEKLKVIFDEQCCGDEQYRALSPLSAPRSSSLPPKSRLPWELFAAYPLTTWGY